MPRWSWLATLQSVVAGAIIVAGIHATITALYDIGFSSRVDPTGGPARGGDMVTDLEQESPRTATEGRDLAFALLMHGDDHALSNADQTRVVREALRGFRDYLAQVPADGGAWAGLASAHIRLGEASVGAEALRMSILTAPWSNSLVQWRCGMAIDLFGALNAEEWELMQGQFRVAAQRSVSALVETVVRRNGTRIARLFLASSPNELIKFEMELAKRR